MFHFVLDGSKDMMLKNVQLFGLPCTYIHYQHTDTHTIHEDMRSNSPHLGIRAAMRAKTLFCIAVLYL